MLINGPTDGPLQIVAAAVTPVVMVSATAILITGVNARYIAVSDRMRNLTREAREAATAVTRRAAIQRQMRIFQRRVHLVSWAARLLYIAVAVFMTVALLISAAPWRGNLLVATLPFFLIGIMLIMVAIACQIVELQESNRTIFLESEDVMSLGDSASEGMLG